LTVRDGEKGPVDIEMVKRRVQTRIERKRTGPVEWLVGTRRPLADDRELEPKASPDATDQDARYRHHYVRREVVWCNEWKTPLALPGSQGVVGAKLCRTLYMVSSMPLKCMMRRRCVSKRSCLTEM
jgi:hypothetical protein